jgi:hypothetical protein
MSKMAESKYGKYVLREPKGMGAPPKRSTQVRALSLNEELAAGMGGVPVNFNFMGVVEPGLMADPPHKHEYDELLFFITGDPGIAPDLGGEVEIALGEEWEKQVISTSAVVCLPRGLQHCPINVKKVNRPFYFGHIMLAAKYSSSASPKENIP